jgi:hypothetical protein
MYATHRAVKKSFKDAGLNTIPDPVLYTVSASGVIITLLGFLSVSLPGDLTTTGWTLNLICLSSVIGLMLLRAFICAFDLCTGTGIGFISADQASVPTQNNKARKVTNLIVQSSRDLFHLQNS